jgi:DNA-binding transcriptional LysR family regulator
VDIGQMKSFIRVVERGSFSKAAADEFVSPQAMMQQMNSLEAQVGTALFVRGPRGVQCTPAGHFLYEKVKTLDRYFDSILEECRKIGQQRHGLIRVGISSIPICLPVVVRAFERSQATVDVREVDVEDVDAVRMLLEDEVDVVEVGARPPRSVKGVAYARVARFHPMCVVAQDHPLAAKESVDVDDLAAYDVWSRAGVPGESVALDATQEAGDGSPRGRALSKDEAVEFCLSGGVVMVHLPSTAVMFPLVSIPLRAPRMEAGLLTRAERSSTERAFAEVARMAFDSRGA